MATYLRDEQSGKVLVSHSTSRPEFGNSGGHTWDSFSLIVDGNEVNGHYDSTWGRYLYFELDGTWYKVSLNLSDYEDPFTTLDEYPRNSTILTRNRELETVSKTDFDSFLEEHGFEDYSPY